MSEGAIIAVVQGAVIIVTSIVGFLTLWAKLKFNALKVAETAETVKETTNLTKQVLEEKIDRNTEITREGTDATRAVSAKLNGGIDSAIHQALAPVAKRIEQLDEHANRISALETKLDSLGKNIDSTRHEMRGHLQTIVNSLHLIGMVKQPSPAEQASKKDGAT